MTQYFDDNSFRDHLRTVLLIGYEWQDQDNDKIEAYFKANQLEVEIECVTPNPEFETLHDEMEAFKTLEEERKEQCLSDGYMGPGKMAKSIMDAIEKIENEKIEEAKRKLEEAEAARVAMIQKEEALATIEVDSRRQTQHEPANPDLPRYACRMCRTILFGENHLAQDHLQHLHSFKKWSNSPVKVVCQSIFCTDSVLAWLSPSGQDIEGKLACPKCLHKVGHWKWAGAQCSCGTWVTPAIQIPVSKVDVVPPRSEIQGVTLVGVVTPAFMASPRF
jgi:dual specificity phosphatase 12